ncbi:Os12g0292200 [Oryza sativa Japonica Group]|uniref:Os12g0292200 protein n=1 Tax=Oryza sativa subsp. japonica TaxID=39947 RepID=A0A0P0Y982_ORYSJ|nr:Os12g0292200 [Oryza sativa Japonica Group]
MLVCHSTLGILSGEKLQCYIRALADVRLRMNSITIIYQKYFCVIAGNYISSNVVKKYQHPNPIGTNGIAKEAPSSNSADEEVQPEKAVLQEYCDTRLLPFPQWIRKPSVDEQFTRFVEVIQKIHINMPLLDAMQVPTCARYLKDILNNKRPLPTKEVVKLTEQCSNAILHKLPEKKKYSRCPTITCSIGAQ